MIFTHLAASYPLPATNVMKTDCYGENNVTEGSWEKIVCYTEKNNQIFPVFLDRWKKGKHD